MTENLISLDHNLLQHGHVLVILVFILVRKVKIHGECLLVILPENTECLSKTTSTGAKKLLICRFQTNFLIVTNSDQDGWPTPVIIYPSRIRHQWKKFLLFLNSLSSMTGLEFHTVFICRNSNKWFKKNGIQNSMVGVISELLRQNVRYVAKFILQHMALWTYEKQRTFSTKILEIKL